MIRRWGDLNEHPRRVVEEIVALVGELDELDLPKRGDVVILRVDDVPSPYQFCFVLLFFSFVLFFCFLAGEFFQKKILFLLFFCSFLFFFFFLNLKLSKKEK